MKSKLTIIFLIVFMLASLPLLAQEETSEEDLLTEPSNDLLDEGTTPADEAAPQEQAEPEVKPEPATEPEAEAKPEVEVEPEAEAKPEPPAFEQPSTPVEEVEEVEESAGAETEAIKEWGNDWTDFPSVNLNFVFSDDNLLDNSEFSPAADIGPRENQDYSQSHLVLYKRADGYWKGLLTEAALVLKFKLYTDSTGSTGTGIADDGSYVKVGYVFDYDGDRDMTLDITGFPFDADAFLLGYHYDLSWAGESAFPQNGDPVPGLRISFDHPWFYVFAGMKTHRQPKKDKLNTERVPVEAVYAGLFGVGVKAYPGLLIEANGGVIQKGDNPLMPEIAGNEKRDDIISGGASLRVSYNDGLPIANSLNMRLWQNDPRNRLKTKPSDKYETGRFSWLVSGEFDFLSEPLQDPEVEDGTKAFNAIAGMLQAKFKYDHLRIHVDGMYRTLEFLLFNTPGFIPFQAFPSSAAVRPEISSELAIDYHISKAHLTLGLAGGLKVPATYKGASNIEQISVVKDRSDAVTFINAFDRNVEILPPGKSAANIIHARFNAQFDMSDYMSLLLEINYINDKNKTKLATSEDNSKLLTKVFEDSSVTNMIGVTAMLRANF